MEDKTEDFAGNPTRDALADGLMCMIKVVETELVRIILFLILILNFKPTVDVLDKNVAATLQAQAELKSQISLLQAQF